MLLNAYGAIILAALLGTFLLELGAGLLDLRALRTPLPAELAEVYDAAAHQRCRAYLRARGGLALLASTLLLTALLLFWIANGFPWLDALARGCGLGLVVTGLLFLALLALGRSLLMLPLRIYSTFGIEQRFGFNRTTARVFVTDRLKGLVLALLLGTPLLAGILLLLDQAGDLAWLLAWLLASAVLVFFSYVAPSWFLPWFHRFQPLPEGGLRSAIVRMAQQAGFPLQQVLVLDGSRRSSKANAFLTGFGRSKRIALYDTLVEKLTEAEVLAVLAHEIGHYRRRHVPQALLLGIAQLGVLFLLLSRFLDDPGLYQAFRLEQPSAHAGLVLFLLLFTPAELLLSMAGQALSRRNELAADRFAVALCGGSESLASALQRLARDHLAHPCPHPLGVLLHDSHPPLRARLRRLAAAAPSPS